MCLNQFLQLFKLCNLYTTLIKLVFLMEKKKCIMKCRLLIVFGMIHVHGSGNVFTVSAPVERIALPAVLFTLHVSGKRS